MLGVLPSHVDGSLAGRGMTRTKSIQYSAIMKGCMTMSNNETNSTLKGSGNK